MLSYKFNRGLVRTGELVDKLSIPISTLDYWKFQWKKNLAGINILLEGIIMEWNCHGKGFHGMQFPWKKIPME